MATANFTPPKNASKYFVVGSNREVKFSECECGRHREWEEEYIEEDINTCLECGEEVEHGMEYHYLEEWEWDDIVGDINHLILDLPFSQKTYGKEDIPVMLSKSKQWDDTLFEVRLKPIIHSGYYEAANLDFEVEVIVNCDEVDYMDFNEADIRYGFDYQGTNAGLISIFTPQVKDWVDQTVESLSESLESVYNTVSDVKLTKVGSFSNGSAVYKEIV